MNKLIYALVSGIIISLCGCQNLDQEFPTAYTKEQIEKNYDQVKMLLNNIYSDLPDGFTYIGGEALMASRTDEAEFTYETNPVQNFNSGSWNGVTNPDMVWGKYYMGIRKVNEFLQFRGKIDLDYLKLNPGEASQALYNVRKNEIERWGYEAKFLRAYFYFELVKRYGGVPLLNSSLSLEEDFKVIKRNTLQECIDFIVKECDECAVKLPLNASTAPYTLTEDLGRVTSVAALALKSRVLLYAASDLYNTPSWAGSYSNPEFISLSTGDRSTRWKAASDAAKEVIDAVGNIFLGTYAPTFGPSNYRLPEVILCRRNGVSNNFERINSSIGFPNGRSGNTPSQNLVDAYEVKVSTTVAEKFDWSNPAMAANPYANRDPRLGLSVVVNASQFGNPQRTVQLWEGGIDAYPITNASKTGYYLRKYVQENLDLRSGQTGVHSWVIFRLPEFFLNYAEALNEWNPGHADIKTYYDKTRTRLQINMPRLQAGLSQDEVREKIRNEKWVEFAFEDHRLWDVKRWMTAPQTLGVPLRGVRIKSIGTGYTYEPFNLENRIFEPKMYFYPIPQSDININGNLTQNPFW